MLDTSKIYTSSKCGNFKIIRYTSKKKVLVEFVGTGYQSNVYLHQVKTGNVKDRLKPCVLGVGFIGDGKHKSTTRKGNTKAYKTWRGMLERCYCPKYQNKTSSYKGCSVSKEWFDFQVFAEWFYGNYIEGFELDKDIKLEGNRVYSQDSCLFVSKADNVIKANAKHYTFISPKGDVVGIYNMNEFCRNSELDSRGMIAVSKGRCRQYKGWVKAM